MYNSLNDKLIEAIKVYAPEGSRLIHSLLEILPLGKEAIYRRLRGEVPFTLEEAVMISQKLGISLDQLSKTERDIDHLDLVSFDFNTLYTPENYFEKYCDKMNFVNSILKEMTHSKKTILRGAYSFMPYSIILLFKKLSQFRHYKWNYLVQGVNPDFNLSDMHIPPHVLDLENELTTTVRMTPKTVLILGKDVFAYLLNDITYFYQRNRISEEEILEIKEELLLLVSYLERLTASGTYDNGTEVNVFLSEIILDSSYSHFEYDDKQVCFNWSFFVDFYSLDNSKISQKQKEWIELLKRYSIPITQSNEELRFKYLKKQRELIEELGKTQA